VVGEVEEELVLDDRAAHRNAKLVLSLHRLVEQEGIIGEASVVLVEGIEGVPAWGTVVFEDVAMKPVGSGFGDGIDDTTGSLAQFCGVAADAGLELLDRFKGIDVGGADGATARL